VRWLSGEHVTDLDYNSKESRFLDPSIMMSGKQQSTPSNQSFSMTVEAAIAETGKVARWKISSPAFAAEAPFSSTLHRVSYFKAVQQFLCVS